MDTRRIEFVIDSDIENVSLLGMSINKICSSASFSEIDCFNIELCVVEAVTNSIKHAHHGEAGNEVKVVLTLTPKDITLDVYDTGVPMDPKMLDEARLIWPEEEDSADPDGIAEGGRGLGIMKEIMDGAIYRSEKGGNRLTLKKALPTTKIDSDP